MTVKFAAPPYLGTLFFHNLQDTDGWSESYWVQADNYGQALNLLTAQIAPLRSTLLTSEFRIVFARVSDASIRNDTLISPLNLTGTYTGIVTPVAQSLPSNDCLLLRVESQNPIPQHAIRPIRGVPKDCISPSDDRLFVPTADYATRQTNFAVNLIPLIREVLKNRGTPPPNYIAWSIQSMTFQTQIRSRNVGRPFGLFRGRHVIA